MKKQRLLSLLLAITTVLAMIPTLFIVAAAERSETVTLTQKNANGYYDIPANAAAVVIDEITYVVIDSADQMNSVAATGGNNYILANDLDYTGKTFQRIKIDNKIFDGNGFAMYGYTLVDSDNGSGKGVGVSSFARPATGSEVIVRNLSIGKSDAMISVSSSFADSSAGAVFEYANATHTIENVTVYANITGSKGNTGGFAGNIVGAMTLTNCKFYGSLTDNNSGRLGGLVGKANGAALTMTNCVNYGTVKGSSNTGGFLGEITNSAANVIAFRNCVNYGTISSGSSTGGFIGSALNFMSLTVADCLNAGEIKGGSHTGGLAGYYSDTTTDVVRFASIGKMSGNRVGGIIGSTVPGTPHSNPCVISLKDSGLIAPITSTGRRSAIIANQTGKAPTVSGLVGTDSDSNPLTSIERTTVTLETGVKWLREKFPTQLFAMSDDGLSVVIVGSNDTAAVAETKFLQYKTGDSGLNIRVLGVLNDTDITKYANVGFDLTLKKNGEVKYAEVVTADTVYTSILANEENGLTTYTAEDLGATYLYALELLNIPTEGTYTIEVHAFATEIGAATPNYDNLVVITVVNGMIQ